MVNGKEVILDGKLSCKDKNIIILLSVVFVPGKRGLSVRILGKPVQKLELDLMGTEAVLKLMTIV